MVVLTNVSLEFNGETQYMESALRQAQGIANLWTISLWMKPFETASLFDADNRPLFRPDGKAVLHIKGELHHDEILIWGERVDNSVTEEYVVVENWNATNQRIRISRFNLAQKREEWRQFSCVWDGTNLIALNNGVQLPDYHDTFSGTGSFIMEDPTPSGRYRSVRIGAAYSGIATTLEGPRLVTYSGQLGSVAVWDGVLTGSELREIASGTLGFDLTTNSGSYSSSANLQHWWRLGADSADIGADYAISGSESTIDVGTDATVTNANIVVDAP